MAKIDNKNVVAGGDCGVADGDRGFGLIASRLVVQLYQSGGQGRGRNSPAVSRIGGDSKQCKL